MTVAVRALLQEALVYGSTLVADGVRDVEREVVAPFLSSHLQQVAVLLLRQVLLKIHVQSRTTSKVLNIRRSMKLELVDDVQRVVLHDVEIAVVAVAWHEITVLTVPLSVLNTNILGRNHLAVEQQVLGAILLVVLLHQAEYCLHIAQVVLVVADLDAKELGSLNETVHTNGEILTADIDITSIEQRQHARLLQFLQILVVCYLHLVAKVYYLAQELCIYHLVVHGILDAAVKVDGEHTLRAC